MNSTQKIKQLELELRQANKWVEYLENTVLMQDGMLAKLNAMVMDYNEHLVNQIGANNV